MRRLEITPGTAFGELKVLREVEAGAHGKRQFVCVCSCGREVTVRLDHLRSGHTISCGRCGIEWNGERKTIAELARKYGINESTLRARLKVMGLREALKRR